MAESLRYELFELTDLPASSWKNGGGTTTALACWPRGADLSNFDARVSIASVTRSGPFSSFEGIDRTIMLIEGAGLRLQSRTAGIDHALVEPWQPYSFAGEIALECDLLGDASRDFNVMVRRNTWRADLRILRHRTTVPSSRMGLLFAAAGAWEATGGGHRVDLRAGAAVRWGDPAPDWNLRPIPETGTPTALVVAVLLHGLGDG